MPQENVVSKLLHDVKLPRMFLAKQKFETVQLDYNKIEKVILDQLNDVSYTQLIRPGMRIAITCGSREIANIVTITKTLVDYCLKHGAQPFIIASMGSHGGATEQGQHEILAKYHITEETMGCPIKSRMDVVKIGQTDEGNDVYIGKDASEADGIIVCGRIKPHTCFRGPYESGIMKMMTIGLGKQAGAAVCHEAGFRLMAHRIPLWGKAILKNAPILFALAILENANDQTAELIALHREEIVDKEPILLERAKSYLPHLVIPETDVLVVDQIGKNFSGSGMDPNVTGTFLSPYASGGLKSKRVAILDISDESHHSGVGMGMGHATTRRAFEKMDFDLTYPNLITSTLVEAARIPMVMRNDREALQLCVRTCPDADHDNIRIVRIMNSLRVQYIYLSEAFLDEARQNRNLDILTEPCEMDFDEDGNFRDLAAIGAEYSRT